MHPSQPHQCVLLPPTPISTLWVHTHTRTTCTPPSPNAMNACTTYYCIHGRMTRVVNGLVSLLGVRNLPPNPPKRPDSQGKKWRSRGSSVRLPLHSLTRSITSPMGHVHRRVTIWPPPTHPLNHPRKYSPLPECCLDCRLHLIKRVAFELLVSD
jgi:hypothetical protein